MDLSDDLSWRSMDPSNSIENRDSPGVEDGDLKSCTDCRTTKTPLWRGGPEGPKTLCNACGIRYRKKRREALGLPPEPKKEKKSSGVSLKIQMLGLGQNRHHNQVVLKHQKHHYHHHFNHGEEHRNSSWIQKQRRGRRRINEVEQAAVLLMALSSGLFYA